MSVTNINSTTTTATTTTTTTMTSNTTNEEFIKKNKTTVIDNDKNTKLHYSAANGLIDEVKNEIDSGRKLDPENYLGWTPLMMAVRNNRIKIVEVLLEAGADATKKNRFGMNVFLISITSGNLDMVTKILNHLLCGGVSRQNLQKTFSPLSLAILFSQNHIFKYFLQQSFDINAATPRTGLTPLMFAAAMCNNKAIKRLIEKNADTSLKNYINRTAQDIVITRNTSSIDIEITPKPQSIPQRTSTTLSIPLPPQPQPQHQPQPQIQIQSPIFMMNPSYSPCVPIAPPPTTTSAAHFRKSSNLPTPNILTNITPITPEPTFCHQIFFPPDFTPSKFLSPNMAAMQRYAAATPNELLNATMNPHYISPFPAEMYYTHSPSYI